MVVVETTIEQKTGSIKVAVTFHDHGGEYINLSSIGGTINKKKLKR